MTEVIHGPSQTSQPNEAETGLIPIPEHELLSPDQLVQRLAIEIPRPKPDSRTRAHLHRDLARIMARSERADVNKPTA
jgi:hypothetical protein